MDFNFSKFEGRNDRLEKRITITRHNSIGFPSRFFSDNNIANYKNVVLYWDKNKKAIGIKFTNDDTDKKSNFSIIKSKVGYGGSVSAKSFFKANSIGLEKYHGRYEWLKHKVDGVGELYVIELEGSGKTG